MTKEFPKNNANAGIRMSGAGLFSRLCHSLVIRTSLLAVRLLVCVIRLYRWTISPVLPFLFGPTGGCRFTPSCSQYAMDVLRSRGVWMGGGLAVKRICRCHPWGGCGHDPAPQAELQIHPASLRFDAARVEACRADAVARGGNSKFQI